MKTEDELFREIMADLDVQDARIAGMYAKMEEIRRLLRKLGSEQELLEIVR